MTVLHFDVETFSELPIDNGTHAYLGHHSTEFCMLQWALDDAPVEVLDHGGHQPVQVPPELREALLDPAVTIAAFNAEFERTALRALAGIEIEPERWLCTMARAWSLSFVGGLDKVTLQMFPGEADKQKLARARRIMLKLTQPRRPSKKDNRTRWTDENAGPDWEEFREYGAQDVVASREVLRYCDSITPWPPFEREVWCLDQRINDLGWPVNERVIRGANAIRKAETDDLYVQLECLTGLANPNSRDQMMAWLADHYWNMPDLQKATVAESLKRPDMPSDVRQVLEIRAQLQRRTPMKWDALERGTTDGAIRATLEFGAAQRTQRWGGRLFQPQNLYSARGWSPDDLEALSELLERGDWAEARATYADVMTALSAGIRGAVQAEPGHLLAVCDLSSIESRVLGWLSGCKRINTIFAEGKDTYRDLASRLFNKPYDSVTKEERTYCKPPDLGCGYYLGAPGLVEYAAGMGVTMELEDAKRAVWVWRDSNPEVVQMWDWLRDATFAATQYLTVSEGYGVRIYRERDFLFIDLPSGRRLHYYQPKVVRYHGRDVLTYMGRDENRGGGWSRLTTHPGKVTENIDQAMSRDILCVGMLRYWKLWPGTLRGHVHDEAIAQVREDEAESALSDLARALSASIDWAPGLLLDAAGFITRIYRKD